MKGLKSLLLRRGFRGDEGEYQKRKGNEDETRVLFFGGYLQDA